MTWPYGSHASTFGGNPVACAAANATMDLLEQGMMENARVVGAHLKARLEEIAAASPHIAEIRGRGLMLGAEIVEEDGKQSPKLRNRVVMEMFDHGVLILGCGPNTVRFAPPLCLNKDQADCAADAFADVIRNFDRSHAAAPGDRGDSDHGGGA
jgi:4-aminobutyrate aminotransferase